MAHVMGGVSWALQANTTKAFNSTALVGNAVTSSSSSSSGTTTSTATIPSTTSSSSAYVAHSDVTHIVLPVIGRSAPSTSGSGSHRSMSMIQLLVSVSVCVTVFSAIL